MDFSSKLEQYLEDHFERMLDIAWEQANNSIEFQSSLKSYLNVIKPTIKTYQHHQGITISDSELKQRFVAETTILYIVTDLFDQLIPDQELNLKWPLSLNDHPFSWLTINQNMDNRLNPVYEVDAQMGVKLVNYADQLLTKVGQRYLGEFYTPTDLTRHIIDLSGFEPKNLLSEISIVDPTCGSGNILAEVLIQSLKYFKEETELSSGEIASIMQRSFHGYDIQPYAILLTQTVLQFILVHSLEFETLDSELKAPFFKQIILCDPLANYDFFWGSQTPKFDYIVGNPPFMSIKKEKIAHIDVYEEVLSGHPNLYVMFLWWAIKTVSEKGYISFILPQSMLTGSYFSAIRAQIECHTRLRSLTRLLDRKGLVGNADQQMMVISLEKTKQKSRIEHINVRVVRNGSLIDSTNVVQLPYHRIVHQIDNDILWHASDNVLDFEILSCLESQALDLGQLKQFKVGNGSLVWNQHKGLQRVKRVKNSIPLISSASITPYKFIFPYNGKHASKNRPFILVRGEKIRKMRHSKPTLLIKRTTPKKVGRRLICGIPSTEFYNAYPYYLIENHVNYISMTNSDVMDSLYGLMAWLNSDLINFVFQLRNGTTQVSVFELKLLPTLPNILERLATLGLEISQSGCLKKTQELMMEVNQLIFTELDLTSAQRTRIQTVLARTERIAHSTNNN